MKFLKEYFSVRGISAERQLSKLESMGFTLYDVRRTGARSVEFGADKTHAEQICLFFQERGFECTPLPPRGLNKKLQALQLHSPLLILSLVTLFFLSFSMRFIWKIDVSGAGAYAGEVRAFLAENGIRIGMRIDAVNTNALADQLTYRLPRIAWVHARIQGMTLQIDITQGVPAPEIVSHGPPGNIVAGRSGTIENIHVYAGTAAVGAGDHVTAGDVLIYAFEQGKDGINVPVRARGTVIASSYITENASVSAHNFQSERTGRTARQTVIHLPGCSLPLTSGPDFLTSEFESVFQRAGSSWFPVIIEKRTVFELAISETAPDNSHLQAESARLAMQKLLLSVGENDEIVDKWLDYSMIEGGIIVATVRAWIRSDIAVSSPETPD